MRDERRSNRKVSFLIVCYRYLLKQQVKYLFYIYNNFKLKKQFIVHNKSVYLLVYIILVYYSVDI